MSDCFIGNCKESFALLKTLELDPMLGSLGEVLGIKCVAGGVVEGVDSQSTVKLELHTDRGEFPIVNDCWAEEGLMHLEIDGCPCRYTDERLVAACALLSRGAVNAKRHEYCIGLDGFRLGADFQYGIQAMSRGDWMDLRAMSREEAHCIMASLGAPRNYDWFEHFCRDFAWLDEDGKVARDPVVSAKFEGRLMAMMRTCVLGHLNRFQQQNDPDYEAELYENIMRYRIDAYSRLARAGLVKVGW